MLWRHRKLDVPGHLLKASGVSVVDISVLHIGPPVVSARKASGIRLSLREKALGCWQFGCGNIPACRWRLPTCECRQSAFKFLRGLGTRGAALFPFLRRSAGLVGVIPGALSKDARQFLALFWEWLGGDTQVLTWSADGRPLDRQRERIIELLGRGAAGFDVCR